MISNERSCHKEYTYEIWKLYHQPKMLWPRLKFWKKSNSKVKWSRSWYKMKGLARRNTHVKYESPSNNQSKIITKVKVCWQTDSDYHKRGSVRIRVRIDPPHPLVCHKRRLNGAPVSQ
jgi:hypothetical protein